MAEQPEDKPKVQYLTLKPGGKTNWWLVGAIAAALLALLYFADKF